MTPRSARRPQAGLSTGERAATSPENFSKKNPRSEEHQKRTTRVCDNLDMAEEGPKAQAPTRAGASVEGQTSGRRAPQAADDERLDACLAFLRRRTDEEKLAGLLLVTKHLGGRPVASLRRSLPLVLDAVGVRFLARLLSTPTRDSTGSSSPYAALALEVLVTMCRGAPSLAAQMLPTLPSLVALLETQSEPDADLIRVLELIAASHPAACARAGLLAALAAAFERAASSSSASDEAALSSVRALRGLVARIVADGESETPPGAESAFGSLARVFAANQGILKFAALEALNECCVLRNKTQPIQDSKEPGWARDVRSGIGDVLSSRTKPGPRSGALLLALHAMRSLGPAWACRKWRQSRESPGDESLRGQFAALLVGVVGVEVQVALLTDVPEFYLPYEVDQVKAEVAQAKEKQEEKASLAPTASGDSKVRPTLSGTRISVVSERTVLCLELLELFLRYLTSDEYGALGWDRLSTSTLSSIRRSIDDSFACILQYFEDLKDLGATLGRNRLAQVRPRAQAHLDSVMMSAVRCLGAWLAVETEAHRDRLRTVLPYLLALDRPEGDRKLEDPPLAYLVPGLLAAIEDVKLADIMIQSGAGDRVAALVAGAIATPNSDGHSLTSERKNPILAWLSCELLAHIISRQRVATAGEGCAVGKKEAAKCLGQISLSLSRNPRGLASDAGLPSAEAGKARQVAATLAIALAASLTRAELRTALGGKSAESMWRACALAALAGGVNSEPWARMAALDMIRCLRAHPTLALALLEPPLLEMAVIRDRIAAWKSARSSQSTARAIGRLAKALASRKATS